ncbi:MULTISPECIES: hypothetical protein [Methylobacteriaceae]|uniref:hypothetical protein n=1 Tax=Methylobacteriaceae TaxID=119045 RepID=UPI00074F9960|nr:MULTISPECIES: hypothetical protein [Methylobacteriaceae]AMB46050.1 hypothetical protein Y590_14095 [Methylobacterium sp. AMS5]TFZ57900.1 hypothetical protein E4V01_13005 [Methylorubrum sp. Q1]
MGFRRFHPGDGPSSRSRRAPAPASDGGVRSVWRTLPLEGRFEVVYEDARGAWTTRTLDARELRLGPGRTLLGGIDRAHGLYRGLRADRIRRLTEPASGTRIETGILDWLLVHAEAQRKARSARIPRRAA